MGLFKSAPFAATKAISLLCFSFIAFGASATPAGWSELKLEDASNFNSKFGMHINGVLFSVPDVCIPGRNFGADEQGRKLGADEQGRKLGADEQGRKLGADEQGRKLGADEQGRKLGADEQGRKLGADEQGRNFGANETRFICKKRVIEGGFELQGTSGNEKLAPGNGMRSFKYQPSGRGFIVFVD